MSRWIELFEKHAFHVPWENIKKSIKDLKVDNTTPTDVKELARLKKVLKYIEEIINSCDPELIPQSVWNNFNNQAAECLREISDFVSNRNIGHLQNANRHADNLLTYVRPYMISSKSAAIATGKAFRSYSKTIFQAINNINDQTKTTIDGIKHDFQQSQKTLSSLSQIEKKIKIFDSYLFELDETGQNKGLESKIKVLDKEFNDIYSEIKNLHKTLFVEEEDKSSSIKHQISDALSEATSAKGKIDEELSDAQDKISSLKTFYTDVFGKEDKESGKIEGGLKLEIQNNRDKYNALAQEIEGLLPGATSTGLATAYKDVKNSFEKPLKRNNNIFYFSLLSLFCVSFFVIIKQFTIFPLQIIFEDALFEPTKILSLFLYKLPIIIPIIWLAMYSSKRRSETQRLHQEYTHKEAVARSYQGFKKQINELKDNEVLMKKLLDAAIFAIAYNASATLDKKHEEKTPILKILNAILKKIGKNFS